MCGYMSESLHADYYLGLDVNSILVEHHQNRKKTDAMPFSSLPPSSSKCKKTRPNIPLGLICLNNIYLFDRSVREIFRC